MSAIKHPLYIAFIWHMHQPYYKDQTTEEFVMPWVRLHGIKDYYGMPRLIEDIPDAHMTFNLTPCLLEQIIEYTQKLEQDAFITLSLKPVEELTDEERVSILKNFFLANWDTMVKVYSHYGQLLHDRGYFYSDEELQIKQKMIPNQDIQDIQMWHNLAWMDTGYQRNDQRISRLITKGKNFTKADIKTVLKAQKEIFSQIIPQYKKLMETGQVELTTSPYYHPILPLLCDISLARVSSADIHLPEKGFIYPEDCRAQLEKGINFFASVFGAKPKGLWPSEGSVCQTIIPMLDELGIQWLATDEDILAKSLNITLDRDLHNRLLNPSLLYKPYWVNEGERKVIGIFRDRVLSDLIGFVYNKWEIERSVEDFLGRLRMIHQSATSSPAPFLVTIIMDGENAWEFYPHNGRDFLCRLYEAITRDKDMKMVTISEYLEQFPPAQEDRIAHLFPGSWINHNFKVWIGHEEENTAWSYLIAARETFEEFKRNKKKGTLPEEKVKWAENALYTAEGSDWFWWYGDDHFSEHADLFDYLFRTHLINFYEILDLAVPKELFFPISIKKAKSEYKIQPQAFLTPTFDGKITTYFEWLPAVRFRVKKSGGTIHQVESILEDLYYGFDENSLYVRCDTAGTVKDLNITYCIHLLSPKVLKIEIHKDPQTLAFIGQILASNEKGDLYPIEDIKKLAGNTILEFGIPFQHIGAQPKDLIRFVVCLEKKEGEIERWPIQGYFLITAPYKGYEDLLWDP